MDFFDKLGKVLTKNIGYTITLVVAIILFLYFAKGDLIAGIFTAIFALVVYICIMLLVKEYKKMHVTTKKTVVKKSKKK